MTSPLRQPHYGRLVRRLREERDWSLDDLAGLVKMSPGYLRNIETAQDDVPSTRKQRQLARVLNCAQLAPQDANYPDEPPTQPKGPKGPPPGRDEKKPGRAPKRVHGAAA